MNTSRGITILLATLFVLSAGAHGQCEYEVTAVIQAPPCPVTGPPATIGRSINDAGHVVGWFEDCKSAANDHAFVWTPDSGLQELDLPVNNVVEARALDINNNGDICGWYTAQDGSEFFQASFVLTGDGQFINIPALNGAGVMRAKAINDAQQVVGWSGPPGVAFLWQDGNAEQLPGTEDFHVMTAADINESGEITGKVRVNQDDHERAFLWEDGNVIVLPPIPPDGVDSDGRVINDAAVIAGKGEVPRAKTPSTIPNAFKWDEENMQNLGALSGFDQSSAWGLHKSALIAGRSAMSSSSLDAATIWHEGEVYDINDLLVNGEQYDVSSAGPFNSLGQVMGFANDASNDVVGLVLSPVDSPAADVTGDCAVDEFDLITLLEEWSMSSSFADIDEDGVVTVTDLLLLLSNWSS